MTATRESYKHSALKRCNDRRCSSSKNKEKYQYKLMKKQAKNNALIEFEIKKQIEYELEQEAEEYLIELAFQMLDEEAERADIIHQEYKNHIELLIEKGILIRLNVRLTTFKKKNMECFQSWLDFMICIDKNTSSYG